MITSDQNQKENSAPNQSAYACAVCGLSYNESAAAQACQSWCQKHSSCNLQIIKHALKETA